MRSILLSFLIVGLFVISLSAQKRLPAEHHSSSPEQRTAAYLQKIKAQPPLLRAFLVNFPKGGDLHNHLSGSAYAESYIQWAADSGLCVDLSTLSYENCAATDVTEKPGDKKSQRSATDALSDPQLYAALIDAFSLRNHSSARNPGEYQFFDSFNKFGAVANQRVGEMIAESAHRAALQNEHYLELMFGMDGNVPWQIAAKVPWQGDTEAEMTAYRQKLLDAGLEQSVVQGEAILDHAEAIMRDRLKCGSASPDPGCSVKVRYIFQVLRAFNKERVFAQTAAGFEMAKADPRVVGINLVQPEDWLISMRDYDLHMRMLDVLHKISPKVHITLHAGELTFGQVPPEELGQHIPKAIDTGHAERIGHGSDVMYYSHAEDLLREMAQKHIAVEISFSSSDEILGLRGAAHPFREYMQAGVPVVIATDDEGVSRSDITHEYQRAVEEQGATYAELKRISRNSAEYSFLPGTSLWTNPDTFHMNPACAKDGPAKKPSPACDSFLRSSEKARLEWRLEQSFSRFEARQ